MPKVFLVRRTRYRWTKHYRPPRELELNDLDPTLAAIYDNRWSDATWLPPCSLDDIAASATAAADDTSEPSATSPSSWPAPLCQGLCCISPPLWVARNSDACIVDGTSEHQPCPDSTTPVVVPVDLLHRGGTKMAEGSDVQLPILPPSRVFTCRSCGKTYCSLGALKLHIRTHTLPCHCSLCGKSFSRPWLLQGHLRTHTGEKPFRCASCGRCFADRSNLRAHQQTHLSKRRYSCRRCRKSFSRLSLLGKHHETACRGDDMACTEVSAV